MFLQNSLKYAWKVYSMKVLAFRLPSGHSSEGFAMAWNPHLAGHFASGDCANQIFRWAPREGGWSVSPLPSLHSGSIEDLQFKRAGTGAEFVLGSASSDGDVRIWDLREGRPFNRNKHLDFVTLS
jgi:WD40 repeat protein